MKRLNPISKTGVSVVYEAKNSPPIVDIVFVHGLQGHPFKTWIYRSKTSDTIESLALANDQKKKRSVIYRIASHLRRRSSKAISENSTEIESATHLNDNDAHKPIFWPADLLPKQCPNARILVFGYDSKVTKYKAGAVNQSNIFSHSKDLLFSLGRERELNRPLMFVAHSLGGIVVKEMLARSSSSSEAELRNIVESTAMVVFLGTPHRGSQDVVALGEVARSVVSSFGMEITPVILDALGLKTSDLERAQEDFSRLWQKYDFQVKTFQEGLSLAKIGKKVVPDYSSLIGDYREQAETLQANHIEMCRYSGKDDPNYRKVVGELHSIYHSIVKLKATKAASGPATRPYSGSVSTFVSVGGPSHIASGNHVNMSCLESLWFPAIHTRYQSLQPPADQTCSWLFDHELYQDWFSSRSREKNYGLLWIKGKPGAGKSTLMKEAFRRAELGQVKSNYRTASFFFNAKGDRLEHSDLGLFRSLLYQLLPGDKEYLQRFQKMWEDEKRYLREQMGTGMVIWTQSKLMHLFESMVIEGKRKKTLIFIDGLDESGESNTRSMAFFWRAITKTAYKQGVDLNVCVSSRHFPTVTLSGGMEIIVEQHNNDDIGIYLGQRFQGYISTQKKQWDLLIENIMSKSSGVFLWVVLVVEDLLKQWDDGNGMAYLIKRVMDVPQELETLFSNMFSNLEPNTRELTVRFFQWAILATKPLRLYEWHHIMAFIRQPAPQSLREWRQSDVFTESDEQLEKQIRRISRGLVEVMQVRAKKEEPTDAVSIHASAGSLDLEHGDTRIVQVIHESVRNFFLAGNGFSVLNPDLQSSPIGNGHLSIMSTCLDYLYIRELNALVRARIIHTAARMASQPDNSSSMSNQTKSSSLNSTQQAMALIWRLRRYRGDVGSRSPVRNQGTNLSLADSLSQDNHDNPGDSISNIEPRLPTSKISATREEKSSVFEILKSLDCTPGMNIVEWMAEDDTAEPAYLDGPSCESIAHSSNVSWPQMLEDHPALLSYATFHLFTHAQLAMEHGIDLDIIIEPLKDKATWARWIALREDIQMGTTLRSYLAQMGLRWQQVEDDSIHDASQEEDEEDVRPYYRPISVASFSSAASFHHSVRSSRGSLFFASRPPSPPSPPLDF